MPSLNCRSKEILRYTKLNLIVLFGLARLIGVSVLTNGVFDVNMQKRTLFGRECQNVQEQTQVEINGHKRS